MKDGPGHGHGQDPSPAPHGAACPPNVFSAGSPPAAPPEPRAVESLASFAVSLDPDGTLNHRPALALGGVPGFGP